jgi:uncharacterized protein (DUF1330 family)
MAAYVISTCRGVTNPEGLRQYWAGARPTFEGFGAELLAAYAPLELVEGKGPVEGVVIVRFPSLDVAKRWYESAAYQAVKRHRDGAADFELVFVEGEIVPPEKRMPHLMGG